MKVSITKKLMDPINCGVHQLFGYPYCSKYLILCSAVKKKNLIQVWNTLKVS